MSPASDAPIDSEGEQQPALVDTRVLSQIAQRGPEINEAMARTWMAHALARRGHRQLVEHDVHEPVANEQRAAALLTVLLCWSLGAFIGVETGLSWPWWPLLAVGVLIGLGSIMSRAKPLATTLGVVAMLAWFITLALLLNNSSGQVFATHIVPAALVVIIGVLTRRLPLRDAQDVALSMGGVVRGAPLLAPLVLVFLFLPALSSDVWRVANKLTQGRFVGVLIFAVGVLLLLVRLQLRGELGGVLLQRARALSELPARAELTRNAGASGSSDAARPIVESFSDEVLDSYWPSNNQEYVPYLEESERETLLRPLAVRLTLTIVVVGVALTAYIYCLTAVTVPPNVAEGWIGRPMSMHHLVFGWLGLPGGAYLRVAALLGTVATATFLGFVIIEDRFAAAVTDALLRRPVDRFLVLALPYLTLDERQLAASDSAAGHSGGG